MELFVTLLLIGYCLAAPSPQLTGEIRSYHQVGDKIKGEYARLHPDGSVTKTFAFGDTKQGLQYKSYQMDPLGNVKPLDYPGQTQLNQPQSQERLSQGQSQGQPQGQVTGQASQPSQPGAAVPPGVNWFMQQPLVSQVVPPAAQAVDPFGAPDPFQLPGVQDPFFSTNPFLNLWNL